MSDFPLYGKVRRNTLFKAEFPTLPNLKIRPTTANLQQRQYFHDILTLEYTGVANINVENINTGIPVKFTWTQGSRQKTWYGYVAYVSKLSAAQSKKPVIIRCVGSSFVLKKRSQKVYKNKTIPEVAALIAKEHGLKFLGENHTRRFQQLSLSGQSQWEWLHKNAARIGYAMYVNETSLVFKSIDTLLGEFLADVPLFQFWSEAIPRTNYQLDRTLDSFTVLKGEYIEDGSPTRTTKSVNGVDPVTGKPFGETASPKGTGKPLRSKINDVIFQGFSTDEVANSKLAAKLAAKGAAELARFNLPAKAVGQGDPRAFPYRVVYLDGVSREFNGHWLIKEITHMFRFGGDYAVTMQLATDGLKENSRGSDQTTVISSSTTSTSFTSSSLFGAASSTRFRGNSGTRGLTRNGVGTIDISRILNQSGSFALPTSFTGGVDMSLLVDTAPKYGKSKETTNLRINQPFLTNVNSQGFRRTPSLWRSTSPSSSSVLSANLGRKCS